MKSSEIAVLRFMLNEYDWSSKEQPKEDFIKEFTNRAKSVRVVKRK